MNIIHFVSKPFISAKNWFMKASWKKKILVTVLVLVGILVLKSLLTPKKSPYIFESVTRGTVSDTISENGNVTTGQVSVFSTTNGIIEEIYVKNGEQVKAGQNLFKVKSTATPADKAAAYATYMNAVNSKNTATQNKPLSQSQLEAARQQVIEASNAVNAMNDVRNNGGVNPSTKKQYTQEEMDSINSALTSARENFTSSEQKYLNADANIQAGQAGISSTWLAYQATQDSTVTAPISGTVGNFLSHVNDNVTASMTNTTSSSVSSPVLVIGNLDGQYITTQINEVDHPKIKLGQKAVITLSAIKDKTFEGKILGIDTYGTNTSGVITYNVSLSLNSMDASIAPGMTVNIDIETNKKENVLTVANAAIKPYQGGKAVQVIDSKTNKLKYVPVKIGLKGATRTEIISGLKEGMKIITGTTVKSTSGSSSIGG